MGISDSPSIPDDMADRASWPDQFRNGRLYWVVRSLRRARRLAAAEDVISPRAYRGNVDRKRFQFCSEQQPDVSQSAVKGHRPPERIDQISADFLCWDIPQHRNCLCGV